MLQIKMLEYWAKFLVFCIRTLKTKVLFNNNNIAWKFGDIVMTEFIETLKGKRSCFELYLAAQFDNKGSIAIDTDTDF